ncbi:ABC transporter permease [Paenibacillus sp. MMS20-IR301]|uniref:ABC transporter permease n=1 Tax=Paenibacillus sp. MMS20-IR301 TaxID=2895946 RepID=UPI0028EC1265|nr:ABC transporter permease [Paenibacillus sp. MMS20-IR301]WNS45569.1 ABC transporter permease [Paenibacillus sp. MMS20-IR301]
MNSSIISLSKKAVSLLILCLLWQFAAMQMDPFVLPGPLATLRTFLHYFADPEFYYAVCRTLYKLLAGMVIVLLLGGSLGLLIGIRRSWKPFLEPVIDMMQSIPPIAWLGIAIIWFGLTDVPSIFIIVLSTTPVLVVNLYEGFASIDGKLLRMARVYHVPRRKVMRHIILPSLTSHLKSGMITAAGLGWKLAVMAELLTSTDGIGSLLSDARTNLETDRVFALALFMAVFWNVIKACIIYLFRSRAGLPAHLNK